MLVQTKNTITFSDKNKKLHKQMTNTFNNKPNQHKHSAQRRKHSKQKQRKTAFNSTSLTGPQIQQNQ